ncbi:MAG: sigma-54-dependent Fis family transcriptional regulator [Candidatus Tectomicrobia bacterium]|uniref:DNA-binding transcriptional regulator NtrC n=1 Tax=Tectimicrobiota bacterium TaxID=2528274 RepID=A0A932LZL2_UNCTE|nr:sigma-54-dependent Fis family transcriptional regulator [Candidatus Tectomicrobia bacterium]
MKIKNILLASDDRVLAQGIKAALESQEWLQLTHIPGRLQSLETLAGARFDLILSDQILTHGDGRPFLSEIKRAFPDAFVVFIVGQFSISWTIKAMEEGACDYLTKPVKEKELLYLVTKLLRSREQFQSAIAIDPPPPGEPEEMDQLVGNSPEIFEIFKIVGKAAQSDATVLIQGENGTGKELIAKTIHRNSHRKARPMITVNCAAIPETLLESELFGHEKGAFTGAISRKTGKFELCHGGTIFLDEIGDMSLLNQSKVLRFLQEREFERVGGNETIQVDVRVIASSNESLVQKMKEKKFRADLFYRLRVVSIYLPPLRERKVDIPQLTNYFLHKYTKKFKKSFRAIDHEAVDLLKNHPWPGNVRELRHVLEQAVLMGQGEILSAQDISLEPVLPQQTSLIQPSLEHNLTLEELEWEYIQAMLQKTRGNKAKAARLLGISKMTLYRKERRWGALSA